MRRSRLVSIIAVMISLSVFGLLSSLTSRADAAQEEIPVGVCTGLTGPFAGFGGGGISDLEGARLLTPARIWKYHARLVSRRDGAMRRRYLVD